MQYQPTEDYLRDSSPFVGVVVDNLEPSKKGISYRRGMVRIRIDVIHDSFEDQDLPWVEPRQDIDGKAFRLPPIGRMMNVWFPSGNIYHSEYGSAIHYDPNLQGILNDLDDETYDSMTALLVDSNTQFYVNKQTGLTMDYKDTGIHISPDSNIGIRLQSQDKKLTIGSEDADQPIILGKNFTDWFSTFIDHLSGSFVGPYLGNLGAPVIPNPAFIAVLQQYKAFLQPRFLSKNALVIDNFKTTTRKWEDQGIKDMVLTKIEKPVIEIKK